MAVLSAARRQAWRARKAEEVAAQGAAAEQEEAAAAARRRAEAAVLQAAEEEERGRASRELPALSHTPRGGLARSRISAARDCQ